MPAIFQIYVGGPLTGAVLATLIRYLMRCGFSGQHHQLAGFISPPSCSRLRVRPRLVQYVAVACTLDDATHQLPAGGPPVCYVSDASAATSLSANKNAGRSSI